MIIFRGKWANKFTKCQQCGTDRFRHRAKGYCIRCYPLIRRLQQVSSWDLANAKSLKGYPRDEAYFYPTTFEKVKLGVALQIQERLAFLQIRERQLVEPLDGLDFEYILNDIGRRCKAKNKYLFHGIATTIDHNFDMEQKRILYRLLNEIQENIPWKGINWNRVFQL